MLETEIRIPPELLHREEILHDKVSQRLGISPTDISHLHLLRRSIDARKRQPLFVLKYQAYLKGETPPALQTPLILNPVANAEPVIIVGFGPAGMFAALKLIELGLKPVILERGKEIRGRRRDLALLNREGIVNPESNYCFGEGGAGTFSDGKLYTRSHKRGDVRRILDLLVQQGATRDILIDAHPHIGTNKLPQLVQNIRETILECGSEIHFDTRVTDLIIEEGSIRGAQAAGGLTFKAKSVILATGHSARDIFYMLDRNGVTIEAKPFALGVRVEHPQAIIDAIQYNCPTRHENLPAASYALVQQVQGRGVYSFCMCPGGIICPAATAPDELVVNGWSPSKRNSPYANSGIVVEVTEEELAPFAGEGIFAGLAFQQSIEKAAFQAGGGKQVAPAQRLNDFVKGKISGSLPDCSYLPGIHSADLKTVLPTGIQQRLAEAFQHFGRKMRGYLTHEAVVVATESRTSSPIRIPRDRETLMHPQVKGLFPCGEGAGYAGGIMSAAMDGERCAEMAVGVVKG